VWNRWHISEPDVQLTRSVKAHLNVSGVAACVKYFNHVKSMLLPCFLLYQQHHVLIAVKNFLVDMTVEYIYLVVSLKDTHKNAKRKLVVADIVTIQMMYGALKKIAPQRNSQLIHLAVHPLPNYSDKAGN